MNQHLLVLAGVALMVAGCCGGETKVQSEPASKPVAAGPTAAATTAAAVAAGPDCKSTDNCKKYGDCTAKDGKCIVGSDEDCKQATVCKDEGRCKLLNGMCTSP